jgi:hypothetical protein
MTPLGRSLARRRSGQGPAAGAIRPPLNILGAALREVVFDELIAALDAVNDFLSHDGPERRRAL